MGSCVDYASGSTALWALMEDQWIKWLWRSEIKSIFQIMSQFCKWKTRVTAMRNTTWSIHDLHCSSYIWFVMAAVLKITLNNKNISAPQQALNLRCGKLEYSLKIMNWWLKYGWHSAEKGVILLKWLAFMHKALWQEQLKRTRILKWTIRMERNRQGSSLLASSWIRRCTLIKAF